MNGLDILLHRLYAVAPPWQAAAVALLTAFIASMFIAKTYEWTHRGLSWSSSLPPAMVLGAMVACTLMLAIGDNIAGAIASIGTLAVIQFRNNLRDPRDMVFVFAGIAAGASAGMQSISVSILGSLAFSLVAWLLARTAFGSRHSHDGLLRMQMQKASPEAERQAGLILREQTRSFTLVTVRELGQGSGTDYSYQITIGRKDPLELIKSLREIPGMTSVSFSEQRGAVEL